MSRSKARQFSIGVDYGTNSVRTLIVDAASGREVGTYVYDYPSGKDGILLDRKDPNLARQNPADYIKGFHVSVREAVEQAGKAKGFDPRNVVGIGIDTTGSTPIPVDRETSTPTPGCGKTTRDTPRPTRSPKLRRKAACPTLPSAA